MLPPALRSASKASVPLLAALTLLAACGRRTPPPSLEVAEPGPPTPVLAPPPPEPIRVPEGCEINLGGHYRLAGKSGARYRIDDDGARATVHPLVLTAAEAGAGPHAPEPEPAPELWLERTALGFRGQVLGQGLAPSGKVCPVTFAAQIVRCDPRSVTLRSEDAVTLDDDCVALPVEGAMTDKVLTRE